MCFFPVQSVLTWHLFDSHNQTRLHPNSPLSQWQGKKIQQVLCKHPGNLVSKNLTMFNSPPLIDNKAGISSVSSLSQCSNNRIKALFYFPTDTVPPLLWKLSLSLKKQYLTGWGWNSVHISRVNLFIITAGNKEEDNLSQNYAIFCKGSGSTQQGCYFSGWVYGYTHSYFEQSFFFFLKDYAILKPFLGSWLFTVQLFLEFLLMETAKWKLRSLKRAELHLCWNFVIQLNWKQMK